MKCRLIQLAPVFRAEAHTAHRAKAFRCRTGMRAIVQTLAGRRQKLAAVIDIPGFQCLGSDFN